MTKIFIEAKSNKTSEYHFLQAIISKFFPAIESSDINYMQDGEETKDKD